MIDLRLETKNLALN